MPIGRPLANTARLRAGRAAAAGAVGVPGELMVSGVQLARGYLKRPDLTAEKFIANPYSVATRTMTRLYRTGAPAVSFRILCYSCTTLVHCTQCNCET